MASKSKKAPAKAKPVPFRANHTVRECLTWHYQKGFKPDQESSPPERYLITKGGVGKGKDYGYIIDSSQPHVVPKQADDGTVIEALRGWPHHKTDNSDIRNNYNGDMPPTDPSGQGHDTNNDPWMSDLISHRFLNDAVRRRQQEAEDALNNAATARSKKSGQGKAEFQGNRTSQLRSIALAEKVEVQPRDLWQMPKFKKNAKAHLSTKNPKQKGHPDTSGERTGSARGAANIQNGSYGDPCTRDTKNANNDDIHNLDCTYNQPDPLNNDVDPFFQDEKDEDNMRYNHTG